MKIPQDKQVWCPKACENADIFGFNKSVSRIRRKFDGIMFIYIYLADYAMFDALIPCTLPSGAPNDKMFLQVSERRFYVITVLFVQFNGLSFKR